ncbi:MAG: hypothetical protein H6751_08320 [Candidatus Omnitrophica bacterium]|nr:hypothetical protein [Candidatus Omnitrophota bacterium]
MTWDNWFRNSTWTFFLLLSLFLGCGGSEPNEGTTVTKILSPSVSVDTEDWWQLRDEMENHFLHSVDRIAENKFEEASREIRMGAVFVRAEAGRGESQYQDRLTSIAEDLERVALEIQSASEVHIDGLKELFGETEFLVSQHHAVRAQKAYDENNAIALGRAMVRAADGLERAYHWTGEKVSETTRSTIDKTKQVANDFLAKSKMVKDSVSTPLKPVNKEFEKFGEKINYKDPKRDFTTIVVPKPSPTPSAK